jgi:diguanylate cyclase
VSKRIDLSATSWLRIYVLTTLGTLACIVIAFAIDGYSFEAGRWQLPERWFNNLLIPLIVAPPAFFFLLSKLRELSLAHRELLTIASTDPLTNCLNRRSYTALVEGYLSRFNDCPEHGKGALLVLDIDHFKRVNDRYGHQTGDEALKLIADTIKANVRELDLVARMGGEEFSVFLPGLEHGRVHQAAERIRSAVDSVPFIQNGETHSLSLSIGGVSFHPPAEFSDLYRYADQCLYAAKNASRNRIDICALGGPGVPAAANSSQSVAARGRREG